MTSQNNERGHTFWLQIITVFLILLGSFSAGWQIHQLFTGGPPCLQAFIYGQWEVNPGLPVAYRLLARHGKTGKPVSGIPVKLQLTSSTGKVINKASGKTGEDGTAIINFDVPADTKAGLYSLAAELNSAGSLIHLNKQVKVERKARILVTTDKPIYQPGQKVRIRLLGLSTARNEPLAETSSAIEVEDSKGNVVFRKKGTTTRFGIFSADFELADQVNLGAYTIRASIGKTQSQLEIRVKHYKLPPFSIQLTTENGFYKPGETVKGKVSAQYIFGKPVANCQVKILAKTMVEKMRTVATLSGRTDGKGVWHFELPLGRYFVGHGITGGDASVTLEATVTDSTGHNETKSLQCRVTQSPLRVEAFVEGALVAHQKNRLFIIASYADGTPAEVDVNMESVRKDVKQATFAQNPIKTSTLGLAIATFEAHNTSFILSIEAKDKLGNIISRRIKLGSRKRKDSLVVRTDRPIYLGGQSVAVSILSSLSFQRVFIDVLKEGQVILSTACDVRQGEGKVSVDLPAGATGTLEIRAFYLGEKGEVFSSRRVIQVRQAQELKISAKLDKESYRPAEKAKLSLQVTNQKGQGVLAALGCAAVDEAVFALQESRPGLERVFFEIEKELLKPSFQIAGTIPFAAGQVFDDESVVSREAAMAAELYYGSARGSKHRLGRVFSKPYEELLKEFHSRRYTSSAKIVGELAVAVYAIALMLLIVLFFVSLRAPYERPIKGVKESVANQFNSIVAEGLFIGFGCFVMATLLSGGEHFAKKLGPNYIIFAMFLCFVGLLGLWRTKKRLAANEVSASRTCLRSVFQLTPAIYASLCVAGTAWAYCCVFNRMQAGPFRWISRPPFSSEATILQLFITFTMVINLLCILRARHYALKTEKHSTISCAGCAVAIGLLSIVSIAALTATGGQVQSLLGSVNGTLSSAIPPLSAPKNGGSHKNGGGLKAPSRVRRHFPETLLWQPQVITDGNGCAELNIPLADSITQWRFSASAVSIKGELGALTKHIPVFQPFFVDIDAPLALTQNDQVSIPVTIFNYLEKEQRVRLKVKKASWFTLEGNETQELTIAPKQVRAVRFRLKALKPGQHPFLVEAFGSEMGDAVERQIKVEPDGKQFVQTFNGRLAKSVSHEISTPAEAIDGASSLYVKIYPGALSQVIEGLEGLLRKPYGCFEQTSSTTYPNVLVLQYLRATGKNKPKIEAKALKLIRLGYQRLLTFEVPGGGFEWFGREPANNILTAYGVMEFADMCRVTDVDSAVLERTREWLYDDRKNSGAFVATSGGHGAAVGQKRGDSLRTTAYITWALAEAFPKDRRLQKSLDYLVKNLSKCKDAYTLGMAANALVAANHSKAKEFVTRLIELAQKDDEWLFWGSNSESGAFTSRGNTLTYETTAIAAYALIKAGVKLEVANKALAYLVAKKAKDGTWGSTQSTIHCLRALLAASAGVLVEDGATIKVLADDEAISSLTFTKDNSDVLRLISLNDKVKKGRNVVKIEPSVAAENLCYQVVASHYLPWPKETKKPVKKPLTIDLRYDAKSIAANDLLKAQVKVAYNRPGASNMTIVDLGIPPGFSLEVKSIEKLVERGKIARWSLAGNRITLYFTSIVSGRPVSFEYSLRARNPVKALTPTSWIYDYYEPELRDLAEPVPIEIVE